MGPELYTLERVEFSQVEVSRKDMLRLQYGMRGREIGLGLDMSGSINWYGVEDLLKPESKNLR